MDDNKREGYDGIGKVTESSYLVTVKELIEKLEGIANYVYRSSKR